MSLTKEDLQAIRSLMQEETAPIKADIQGMKTDIAGVKTDIAGVKTDIEDIKGDVAALKADMAHHNHTVEPQLKIIREGLEGWSERAKQVDRHENILENQGNRILALEYAFKTK